LEGDFNKEDLNINVKISTKVEVGELSERSVFKDNDVKGKQNANEIANNIEKLLHYQIF
jgi:hypothetical protein